MSNFFQRPLNAGSLPLGVYTALQGCRLARWRLPKVETLQGCNGSANGVACLDPHWRFPFQSIYSPAKVEGWQTYREGRFAVPPKLDRYNIAKIQKKNTNSKFVLQPGTRIASNLFTGFKRSVLRVLIPFKRERAVQGCNAYSIVTWNNSRFNSLQTGKHIASGAWHDSYLPLLRMFQFPSNGKAHRKTIW